MKRISIENFSAKRPRPGFAAALAVGAFALLALDAGLEHARPTLVAVESAPPGAKRAAPMPVATEADQPGVHNLSYYPEQLAVLTSLSSFEPAADAGASEDGPAMIPAPLSPAAAAKTARHAETQARLVASTAPAQANPVAKGAEPAPDRSASLLGVTIPGAAAIGERAAALRDGVSHWSETVWSAGGRITSLWR
jgi:hypothetical protein